MSSVKHSLVDLTGDFYLLSRFYDIRRKRELRDEPDKNMENKAVKKMKLDESDSTCKKMASEDDVRKEGRLPNSWRRPETIELLGDFAHFTRGHFSFEAIFQRERESKTPSFDYSEYRQFDSPTEPIITTAAEMVNCRVYPIRIPLEFFDENVVVVVDRFQVEDEVEDSNRVEFCRQENVTNKGDDVTEDIDVGAEDYYVNVDDDIDKYAYEDVNIDDVYNIGVADCADEDGTINEEDNVNEYVIINEDIDNMVTDDAKISSNEPHEEATAHKDGKSTTPTTENVPSKTSPPQNNSPFKSSTVTSLSSSSPDVNKSTTPKCTQKPFQPSYQKTIPSLINSGFTNNFDQKPINVFNNPVINYFNDRGASHGTRMPLFLPPHRPMNFNPFHQLLPLFAISTNNSRTDFGHLHRSSETPSAQKSSTSKNIRMEVCSHYLEGRCKFGARCLKVHPY